MKRTYIFDTSTYSVLNVQVTLLKFRMKVVIVLCDPIKRLKSDFVHTTKTNEPHARLIKSYKRIEDYIMDYLPKIKSKIAKNPDWLTDIYYHSIASSIFTNG